ncbi:MAG: molybdopterin molybdotransferase MoeA [Acidimicrobiia bacterium]
MLPLPEAQRQVLGNLPTMPVETIDLGQALGLVLARPAIATHPVPPFTNSAMDGYAVRAEDVAIVPIDLKVTEDVPAGSVARGRVETGTAIKIMTGAPLPEGADSVVRVEDTEQDGEVVTIRQSVPTGTSVRAAGGDVAAGSTLVETGVRLNSAHVGVLANNGFARLKVHRRPVVAVASTGDELVPVDDGDLGPGQIRDSNRPMLIALLHELGVQVIDLGRIPDLEERLLTTLQEASERADAIVTSGGVSMGEYDLVKSALKKLGDVDFWQVAMQPAKPFAFGSLSSIPFFGLPGNPVSSYVAFEQFVRPALLHMMTARRILRPRIAGRTETALETDPEKTVFVRVVTRLEDEVRWCRPSGGQSSNVLSAVAGGDAFAVVERGIGRVESGEAVALEMYHWPEERTIDEL